MSVVTWENGTRVVTLGEGTTSISVVLDKDTDVGSGICFAPLNFTGELQGSEVLVEITNTAGVISFLKGLTDLIATWEITGENKEQIEVVKKQFDAFHKKLYQVG